MSLTETGSEVRDGERSWLTVRTFIRGSRSSVFIKCLSAGRNVSLIETGSES